MLNLLPSALFSLGLFFDPESGGSLFLQNVRLCPNYNLEYCSSVNSFIPLITFFIIYSVFLVVNNIVNIILKKGANLFTL